MKTLLLILSITVFSNVSLSNIVYVDNFDAVYNFGGGFFQIDIDNNGLDDIQLITDNINGVQFQGIGNNRVQRSTIPFLGVACATIDCNGDTLNLFTVEWWHSAFLWHVSSPNLIGAGNYRQGFKLEKINPANGLAGNLYGYIDYSFTSTEDVIIHGWYYEDSFGTPIIVNNLTCTPTSSIDSHTACNSYTWVDGNTYTASNNTATYTTTNAAGCDSVVTLDLTINPQSTSSIIETACESYTAPDGQVYNSSGNYSSTIPNAAGCDSVISIDLTINPLPSNDVTQNGATLTATQTVAAYQWVDCDNDFAIVTGEINQSFTPISTGNYAVIVTVNGCSDTSDCRLVDYTGIGELNNSPKQLIKIIDVLGRETPFKPNTPLLYIYNDGTVERKMIIKE